MEYSEPGEIVQRIKQLIEDHGVAANQVRAKIMEITGISKQGLSKWFSGDTPNPRTTDLLAVAYHYKIDLNWIMTGLYAEEWYESVNKTTSQTTKDDQQDQDTHNYNQSYSFQDKQHRDALGNAVHEGVKLGNAP